MPLNPSNQDQMRNGSIVDDEHAHLPNSNANLEERLIRYIDNLEKKITALDTIAPYVIKPEVKVRKVHLQIASRRADKLVKDLQNELRALKTKVDEIDDQLRSNQDSYIDFFERFHVGRISAQLSNLAKRTDELNRQKNEHELRLDRNEEREQEQLVKARQRDARCKAQQTQIERQQAQIEQQQTQLKRQQTQLDQQQTGIEQLKSQMAELMTQNAQMKQTIRGLGGHVLQLHLQSSVPPTVAEDKSNV